MSAPLDRLTASLSDRYRIDRELGAGGMATVYLAQDLKHDRKVALKVLRPELSAILGAERFLAEIKTTANLQHPHILSLFDSGEAGGFVFYAMPFVEGESLRDRLKRDHQLPVDEAIRIAREVADALEYAHRQGIVHRDIKPENILLHGGHAVVADFGIALAASRTDGNSRMTETGMSLGTPHYMSPEQAMGEREITPKADIYALGCVLYEMLTAEPPFVGASAQAIIGRVLTEDPRSLTAQRKTIPPHVEAAVQVALSKLPADRFATAKDFGEALGKTDFVSATTRGPAAAAVGRGAPTTKLARIAPWGIAAAAVILMIATWAWPDAPAPVTRQRTLLWQRPVPAGDAGFGLAISPDGETIVYADSAGGTQQLWSKENDRLEPTPLAGTIGAWAPTFSPDGEWIAFVAEGKVKRVPRAGGSAITIAESANTVLPAVAWLDDGTVLFNNPAYDLQAVSIDGGDQRRVFWVDSTQRGIVTVTPLPGGRGALMGACTFGCTETDLRVLDLRTGEVRILVDEVLKGWYLPGDIVVFVRRDGGVFSVPFDLGSLTFTAAPVPVMEGVRSVAVSSDIQVSTSGVLLYVAGSAGGSASTVEAVWVTRDGVVTPIDPAWQYVLAANGSIALSPDGRRLAVSTRASGNEDVWIKELPNGPFTRLTFEGINIRPTWTADGRSVMYTSRRASSATDVRIRRADGTGPEATLLKLDRSVIEIERTRDSMQLIVRLGAPPSRDIHLATRTAGSGAGDSATTRPLVADPGFDEIHPALSPDGRWLAYASNESGTYEVYVRPFPNTDSGRWQVSRNGGAEPGWAPSGRELFFRARDAAMMATAVTPGPAFVFAEPRALFPATGLARTEVAQQWAVSPDGRRFIFWRDARSDQTSTVRAVPTPVVRVDNWLTELQRPRERRP